VTTSSGTSTRAVETREVALPDRSRPLRIGDTDYFRQCPWPAEAESASIDHATVSLRVVVGADGTTERADVTGGPGLGFARAAIACLERAPRSAWDVALDATGRAVASAASFNLEFRR